MSDPELEAGDRVRTVHMPSSFQRDLGTSEPSESVGQVVDIVEEVKHLGPGSTMEQTLVVIETDDGDEERVNVEYLNADIDAEDGGVAIQRLED